MVVVVAAGAASVVAAGAVVVVLLVAAGASTVTLVPVSPPAGAEPPELRYHTIAATATMTAPMRNHRPELDSLLVAMKSTPF